MVASHEWETKVIGDFLEFKNGLNKGKEYFGHGTPIVNYMDVYQNSELRIEDVQGKVSLDASEIRRFEVRKGDVFFTRTSETPDEVGISSVLLDDIDDAVFSGFVLRGRPIDDSLLPEYCKYCFSTKEVRDQIVRSCTYTTRALTNGKVLSAINILVPPKKEQEAIAEALSDIDALISSLERLIEKKKLVREGIETTVFSEGSLKREKTITCHIGDFAEVITGATPSTTVHEYWGGDIPWLSSGELHRGIIRYADGRITELGFRSCGTQWVPAESVLIALAGQGKTRGTAAFTTIRLCTNQSIGSIIPDTRKIRAKYLYYRMRSLYENLRLYSSGDGGRGGLTKALLADYVVTIHSETSRQAAVEGQLSAMDEEITQLESKLAKYKQIKQGMMHELLTGSIRLVRG